ncbi:DUF2164 domain-containing protein [Vibrio parahaemolyticus]|uniref:DUF2164 domain-containing protein n=17 Tax=Vibrio TaxID=662 RepID=A0A072G241_VIBPH|nr:MULTISPECIES: DUF2164 domain-containing protein [Vibrio]EFO46451.1 conserved hypothetical protein [Vibrio parahaemolyticus AQ4037]EJG0939615.1 DUF2164 domain-containing protein [Vibrio parahaemolyticus O1]EJG0948770.1 DUF2164 domain-containing protein [Vibrio parahaemolyticus O1:K58]ETZ09754.1 hypothetical protein AJ90_13800 [Vibrio parahaemolyticus M0605]KCV74247.1 hypothetical protein Y011_18430 [Vibrio parahaemolyticus VP49]KIT40255.1 hypothetical protein H320_02630 [Vibrio parahaemolyt
MIKLERAQKETLASAIQDYMQDELSIEIGQFDSEFLIDFITDKLGAVYYNKGVEDAKAVIERRMLEMSDELYEIEQEVSI